MTFRAEAVIPKVVSAVRHGCARRPPAIHIVALVASLALIAGCSSAPNGGGDEILPTPAPTWLQVDADRCVTTDLQFLAWDDDVGADAYSLFYRDLGDVAIARKEAGAAATAYVAKLKKLKVPVDVQDEMATVVATLTAAAVTFKGKLTEPQYKAAYQTIVDAFEAFEARCQHIEDWVTANVPR